MRYLTLRSVWICVEVYDETFEVYGRVFRSFHIEFVKFHVKRY